MRAAHQEDFWEEGDGRETGLRGSIPSVNQVTTALLWRGIRDGEEAEKVHSIADKAQIVDSSADFVNNVDDAEDSFICPGGGLLREEIVECFYHFWIRYVWWIV